MGLFEQPFLMESETIQTGRSRKALRVGSIKSFNYMKSKVYMARTLAVSFAAFFLSSCATLFTGTSDMISFNSEPGGAIVFINGV